MKLVNTTITALALFALSLTNVHAGDRRVDGLIIGGGTGAVVGQAIGRNVESTIVGATVGGVVGLTIGNVLDRHHRFNNQHPPIVVHSPRYHRQPQPVFRTHDRDYRRYLHNSRNCRKIVTIERRRHKTTRVISTVCGYNPHDRYKNHYSYR